MSIAKAASLVVKCLTAMVVIAVIIPSNTPAEPVDFNTFTVEDYPLSKNPGGGDFGISDWLVEDGGATATEISNASNTVFYGPDNILNSTITGTWDPGGDDDMPGFVLGFNPGDAEGTNPDASYLVIDWKGADQNFDFTDPDGEPEFHALTDGTFAPAGLAISQVRGLPTADELWGHVDDPNNPDGGVTELARGVNFEFEGYDRSGLEYEIEIIYDANRVQMSVDGELELDVAGNFGPGRFGLYEAYQNPHPIWTDFDIEIRGGTGLLAGDADQDLDFDQLDLVQVQVAAKYLSGQPATWGEGDWDGAPGGSQGSPPPGNGFFDQLDIIAALNANVYLTGPYAAVKEDGNVGDGQTSLVYDVGSGELSVDAPAGKELTSINVTSAGSMFTGDKPAVLDGAFDNFAADNLFKATFGGSFGSISFGNVLPSGLSEEAVSADLSAVGSLAGGGDLSEVDLVYIPEPSTMMLLGFGIASAVVLIRRH